MFIDPIPHYTGLPYVMKQHGYETVYFTTHDDQFDNVGGFLRANYIDRVVSKVDYPSSAVINTLGVPDHYMFSYALPVLNDYYKTGRPFFATMMTVSNHPPYEVPADIPFKPKHREVRGGCVEYADWAIGQFMKQAAKEPWYNNTIFVFLGDHGAWANDPYGGLHPELNHIPCIIYSPLLPDAPKVFNEPAGQADVFPTLAGLLHFSYVNNTMGVDLLQHTRPWVCFGSDDKFGVIGRGKLYVWYNTGDENLYTLGEKREVLAENRAEADSMRNYAFAQMQCAQWMQQQGKTGFPGQAGR
jgi:phosphoglycerol transferase MdoB-like AlkP superfamily enzyme